MNKIKFLFTLPILRKKEKKNIRFRAEVSTTPTTIAFARRDSKPAHDVKTMFFGRCHDAKMVEQRRPNVMCFQHS